MAVILGHTIAALMERFQTEQQAQRQRERVIDAALWQLSYLATDQEKARARRAAREVIRRLDGSADKEELQASAEEVVRPIQEAVEKRLLKERVLQWQFSNSPGLRPSWTH